MTDLNNKKKMLTINSSQVKNPSELSVNGELCKFADLYKFVKS